MSSFPRFPKYNPSSRDADKAIHAVRIDKLAPNVDRQEVIALFHTLIGDVSKTEELKDAGGSHLHIVFSNRDACKKALCMSGYNVSGQPLTVIPLPQENDLPVNRNDERRNLYVLGLPFDLSKTELTAIFSQHGTVSHCVILATVDNASRRRGFVVMSCHDEAQKALTALTRTQMRGHTIDISWAIVQRSQGFLDGGDRAVLFDSHTHPSRLPSPDGSPDDNHIFSSVSTPNSSFGSSHLDSPQFTMTSMPTNTLMVNELPSLLFSQMCDLHPLLDPFGKIDKLEIMDSPSVTPGTISVKVEYTSIDNACEALESLQGQCYANFKLRVEYVQVSIPSMFSPRPSDQYFAMPPNVPAMNFAPHPCRYQPPPYHVYIDHTGPQYSYVPPSARVYLRSNPRPSSVNSKRLEPSARYSRYPLAQYPSNVPVYNAYPHYHTFYN